MTRRTFVQKLVKLASAMAVGAWVVIKKAAPRKFVRALRTKYPGGFKSLNNIGKQSKWSG